MDMYQKRKMRQENKNNDSQESFSKVSISWLITIYPRIGENSNNIKDCEI